MAQNYVLLERIELAATAASVTLANIPQTGYTDLKLVISSRAENGQIYGGEYIFFNGATTNRSTRAIEGTGSSVGSFATSYMIASSGVGSSATANTFSNTEFYIPNYTSSNYKSASGDGVGENNATTAYMDISANLWSSTAAVTSITLSQSSSSLTGTNYAVGSTFSLYGLAAVGTTPVAPKANGGNQFYSDGTYWYHIFTSSGTFQANQALTCDYLVVAGGGGANTNSEQSGGGGGGGLRSTVTATGGGGSLETPLSIDSGYYTITVGAGGALGAQGSNSIFSTVTSTGGGYGGPRVGVPNTALGGNGGSSGGGGDFDGVPGTRTASPVQGYNGGTGLGDSGGGGGGAGGAGGNSSGPTSGTGGAGAAVSITGSSVTYAAGGRGGDAPAGATSPANSGKGGDSGPYPASQTGGSGIVVIRYAV